MTLLDYLIKNVVDPRRAQGKRISLEQMFGLVILGYMCGYTGYRPIYEFCKVHETELVKAFNLKHGIPSYVTIRDVLMRIDEEQLIKAFNEWAAEDRDESAEAVISIDGKALSSTVEKAQTSLQNMVYVVSAYSQKTGLIEHISVHKQKKTHEIKAAIELIQAHSRERKEILYRLDALHCQKKQ